MYRENHFKAEGIATGGRSEEMEAARNVTATSAKRSALISPLLSHV